MSVNLTKIENFLRKSCIFQWLHVLCIQWLHVYIITCIRYKVQNQTHNKKMNQRTNVQISTTVLLSHLKVTKRRFDKWFGLWSHILLQLTGISRTRFCTDWCLVSSRVILYQMSKEKVDKNTWTYEVIDGQTSTTHILGSFRNNDRNIENISSWYMRIN